MGGTARVTGQTQRGWSSLGRTGAAAADHGCKDPQELVEARGPVLQGAGRMGPPSAGERRAGRAGRRSGEAAGPPGADGLILGRGGRRNDPRARGAAGRIRGAGSERRRPSAEPGQLRGAQASGPGRSGAQTELGWAGWGRSRAGVGAELQPGGRTAQRSRDRPPGTVTTPAAAAHVSRLQGDNGHCVRGFPACRIFSIGGRPPRG